MPAQANLDIDDSAAADAGITDNQLLGGRIALLQPATGFRVAIDTIFLAAFVPARARESVFDAGCGVGGASLCLAARLPECRVVGLELRQDMANLARENVARNGMVRQVDILSGSLAAPPLRLAPGSFHHVMTNPPYMESGTPPTDAGRAAAHVEGALDLAGWIKACVLLLRHKGTLTMIHRADRLDDLLTALQGRVGDIQIMPLWPKHGRAASRILLRARRGAKGPLSLLPGLVLHEDDGRYTPEAEAILRDGAGLETG